MSACLESIVTDSSLVTENHPTMSSASANTAAASLDASTGGSANGCLSNANSTQFSIPSGFKLEQFNGTGWTKWSNLMEVIITLQEAEDILTLAPCPTGFDQPD